jgi:hypothetical protein
MPSGLARRRPLPLAHERTTMRHRALSLLCTLACVPAAACHHAKPAPAPTPVPTAARIYYDNSGGIQDSVRVVVRDAQTMKTVWQQATSQQSSPPPMPAIDFTKEMVLVVGAGRMTPEDQIRVDSVSVVKEPNVEGKQEDVLRVVVVITRGCMQFKTDAYPLEIVKVRRFEGAVHFVDRQTQAQGCHSGSSGAMGSRRPAPAMSARSLGSRSDVARAVVPRSGRPGA